MRIFAFSCLATCLNYLKTHLPNAKETPRKFTFLLALIVQNTAQKSLTERPKEPPKEPGETYTIYTPYASFRELPWELEGLTMIYDEFLFIEKVCSEV